MDILNLCTYGLYSAALTSCTFLIYRGDRNTIFL